MSACLRRSPRTCGKQRNSRAANSRGTSVSSLKGIARRKWTVYLLIDPRNDEIRYVGASTYGGKFRLGQHIADSKEGDGPKDSWIKELLKLGMKPIAADLADYRTCSQMITGEMYWINRLRAAGCPLFNTNHRYWVRWKK